MKPSAFLTILWGDPPPAKVYLYTLPNKESSWYTDYNTVDRDFSDQKGQDIYVGMSMLPTSAQTHRKKRLRLDARMAGIPGLWADMDWLDPAHEKKTLPDSMQTILEIITKLPYEPTVIVNSGHGLHVMWLFEKPWLFEDERDQRQAAQLVRWWQDHIRINHYRPKGWDLDTTHPLTQILRVPGFDNLKREPKVPVSVITTQGPRLNLKTALDHARRERGTGSPEPPQYQESRAQGARARRIRPVDTPEGNADLFGFHIDPNAEPPQEKLALALENIENFRTSWENRRKDLYDSSASVHDLSLGNMAARLNWTQQEIVDLLIAFRRRNNLPPKLRYDYYEMTLNVAMEPMREETAQYELHSLVTQINRQNAGQNTSTNEADIPDRPPGKGDRSATDQADKGKPPELDAETFEKVRDYLSTVWGVEILRFIKYVGDSSTYWISTSKGNGTVGAIRDLMDQESFRRRIADITGAIIKGAKNKTEFEIRIQALLSIRQEIDVGDASYPKEETINWLKQYLSNRRPQDTDPAEAKIQKLPYIIDNTVFVHGDSLRNFLNHSISVELSRYELGKRMRQIEAYPGQQPTKQLETGNRTSRIYWAIDMKILTENED